MPRAYCRNSTEKIGPELFPMSLDDEGCCRRERQASRDEDRGPSNAQDRGGQKAGQGQCGKPRH